MESDSMKEQEIRAPGAVREPLLAIDTTGPLCSVCLKTADGRLIRRAGREGLKHLTSLVPMIAEAVSEAGLAPKDLRAAAVSAGPGSFTGIRIGVATIRALAQTLDIPVVKVPTLETFAYLAKGRIACPIFDARRAQMYAGAYFMEEDGRIMTIVPGDAWRPEDFFRALTNAAPPLAVYLRKIGREAEIHFMGDGVSVFSAQIEDFRAGLTGPPVRIGSEVQDAMAVLEWALVNGRLTGYETLEPIYLRKAEAERKLEEKTAREGLDAKARAAVKLRVPDADDEDLFRGDVYGISVIERLSFGEPWLERSIRDDLLLGYSDYVLAERDGVVLGYAGLHRIVGEGHITNIAVHPCVRGQGVGTAVLSWLMSRAEEQSIGSFTLEVRAGDDIAGAFYRKMGFETDGLRKDYYSKTGGGREDALIMWRHI
ncbi:MAG: tRNA (adenosine(37)-N6)-threonylcarbamoyltransferase complex dimerization subunit type 1 TsaB [Clostridiales Family XIII bacterium]|jgi:tRNA threonylcarbamoyl adenosine modification protein YeaZ/ribosomal-protein-alanine acetyltransferase|nr:tRNA (adenosine(37)-N6)-threonylcarbamoyltransferase complex dimerization subunit type 1 TsaB [Clostridiales Family XIII bacterium]